MRVHVAFHHVQRGVSEVVVDVSDGVARNGDLEMPDVRIGRGVQNALLGDLPAEHHVIDAGFAGGAASPRGTTFRRFRSLHHAGGLSPGA